MQKGAVATGVVLVTEVRSADNVIGGEAIGIVVLVLTEAPHRWPNISLQRDIAVGVIGEDEALGVGLDYAFDDFAARIERAKIESAHFKISLSSHQLAVTRSTSLAAVCKNTFQPYSFVNSIFKT